MSAEETGWLRISEVEISMASASAVTMEAASEKRSAGSFARLRMMTADKAGEIFGFISVGGVGIVLICCSLMLAGLLPWKGRVPVQIS